MKRWMVAFVVGSILFSANTSFAASYKEWRKALNAAMEARKKRDYETATKILEEMTPHASELGPKSAAENSYNLSLLYYEQRKFDQDLATTDAALEKIGPNPRDPDLQIWRGLFLSSKAETYIRLDRLDEALKLGEQARTVLENAAGKFHPELYRLNADLALIYWRQTNYIEAEKAFKSALKLAESRRFVVAETWSGAETSAGMYEIPGSSAGPLRMSASLGNLYLEQGKRKEAREYFTKALKIAESDYGKKHSAALLPLEGIARLALVEKNQAELDKSLQRMLELATAEQGIRPWVVNPFWMVWEDQWKAADFEGAIKTARKIAAIYRKQNFPAKEMANRGLQIVYRNKATWEGVAQLATIFGDAANEAYGPEVHKTGAMHAEFAAYAEQSKQVAIARANFEALVKSQENAPDKALLISALSKLGDLAMAENNPAEAAAHYHKLSAAMQQKYGNDVRTADVIDKEAAARKQAGQEQAANELTAKAAEIRKSAYLK